MLWLVCFDMDLVCIIITVLSGHIRSKRVNKLYAYALVWKKTGLHAKFQVHRCYG